jgi:2-polyprenyl-6-methoxyphenol hydroxylase-like FAD-dependent oxidoreductase
MDWRRNIPFLVIGGGIGGLATALALSRKGYPVHVIERSPELGEIGAGIQIAPNGSRVLDSLGILDKVHMCAVFPQQFIMVDAISGEHLTRLEFGKKFQQVYTYPYLVIHRNDLLTVLTDACRKSDTITIETNREVVAVEDLGDGALITCADGSSYQCDALIGADGLRSIVRKCVIDDSELACQGCVAYRGVVSQEEALEFASVGTVKMWVGPHLHFVQYPIRRGELYNQVALFDSYRYNIESNDWGTEDELEDHFAKTHSNVRRSLTRVKRDRRWPLYDRPPTEHENWTCHHITLLGDAAHAMFPYLAQGACQALEDAVCLADMVASYEGNVDKAFLAYQEVRLPRTAHVRRMVRLFGEILHCDGIGAMMRNVLLSQRTPDDYQYINWLYGYQA